MKVKSYSSKSESGGTRPLETRFVDLHMHVLPGMDDGASDLVTSLQMLRVAAESGTCAVCATPHISGPGFNRADMMALVTKLNETVWEEDIPILVSSGAEYQLDGWMIELAEQNQLIPIGNSKNILVELPFTQMPVMAWQIIFEIQARGYHIIVAHPERNSDIQLDISIADELSRKGCMLQVSGSSLTGEHGRIARKTALRLISKGLCNVVATDAHMSEAPRGSSLIEAHKAVMRRFGSSVATELFTDAPRALLQDD